MESRKLIVPDHVWDAVERMQFTEAEARQMIRWAMEQVQVAMCVYHACTSPRPKRNT